MTQTNRPIVSMGVDPQDVQRLRKKEGIVDPSTGHVLPSAETVRAHTQPKPDDVQLQEERAEEERRRLAADREVARIAAKGQPFLDTWPEEFRANPWMNPELRTYAEESLAALPNNQIQLSDLLAGRASQRVPILPGQLEVVFQTVKGSEEALAREMAYADSAPSSYAVGSTWNQEGKMDLLMLSMSVREIAGTPLPSFTDAAGLPNKELMWKRYQRLAELPVQILSCLAIHAVWFDQRVKQQLTPRRIKNG